VISQLHDKEAKIIDVGSALGYTMGKFIKAGFNNVHGVDNSRQMINSCLYPARVTLSETLPSGPWNVVLANWTLHFIPSRLAYLQRIYDNMDQGGTLILTDKMSFTSEQEILYHQFKLDNGVSLEEIQRKKESLKCVLTCKPLSWYLSALELLGFEVINTRLMFKTIIAKK
jgi:tRNA (cmo5U34)-methyltransferase